ncbi:GumC family protein [Pseudoponticoccus marisrubri]|uniref:Chain-length determining protein n=1 Tax=Pseudoponticoccus marisrubri TaxID=1685382 RepID=A0A0W7WHS3_9RHOB|nr:Wzz/FepE/Etk N-terminal domain-containing protein [Pseudoponticoccus marisrubri]KUF10172.1 chain-length determining protein [Pseudoponticoccus marisrubri]
MNQFQSFAEILSALKRRAWVILIVTLLGCVASLYYALNQSKLYEATAVVQIEDARVPDQLAGATAQRTDAARRVRLIEQRLMSRDNLVRIMEQHALFTEDPSMTMNERIFSMREAARIEEIVNQSQAFAPGGNVPSGLLITVRLGDAEKAADVANELMYSVIEQSRDRSVGRARDTLEFFAEEEARVGAEIERMDDEIAEFKRENADQLPSGLTDLRAQLASLRDADLELDRQIVTIETSSSRQREEVTERQIALLTEQKLLLAERSARIRELIAGAPDVERELNRLEREMTQLQDQYSVITRRKAEAEMGQMLEDRQQTGRFEVLETALVPEFPVSRSRKKTAIMGGVASLVAGIAAGFVLELMNPAIRSAAQMERALGVQPVVAIPTVRSGRDQRRRGLKVLAWIGALGAALLAALRYGAERLPWIADLLDRVTPRLARG